MVDIRVLRERILRDSRRWLALLLAGYVVARLVVLAKGEVFTSFDTASYAVRDDASLNHGPLVSFIGDSPRLWGVPLFYAIFPTDWWRAAGQWALSTLAWAALAVVVWTLLRHLATKILASGAILLLALLNQVTNWDFAILSESLSISLGVLMLALLLRWLDTGSRAALVGTLVTAVWWTFARVEIRAFTTLLALVFLVLAWRLPRRRLASLVSAGVLVLGLVWCTAILTPMADAGARFSAFGQEQAADEWILFRLRVQVLPDPEVKAVFQEKFGMPACPAAEEIATRAEWDIEEFAVAYRECPELKAWGDANKADVFNRFAAAAPGPYARMTWDLTEQSLAGATYAKVPTIVPGALHRLVFPGHPWTLPFTALLLLITTVAAIVTGAFRRRRLIAVTGAAVAAACLVSTVAGVLYGTGEFWRFGIQEVLGLRIAMILLGTAALDAALERRRGHPPIPTTNSTTDPAGVARGAHEA